MKQDAIREITERLEQGVKDVFSSEEYVKYLAFMAKFHNYSVNNSVLIFTQMPTATLVAGYKAWQTKHKRQVRKGAKAIKILAPCPHKKKVEDENGDETEVTWTSFRAVSVFDISQTDGEDVPTFDVDELTGDVNGYGELLAKLAEVSPVPIEMEEIESGAKGYFNRVDMRIAINKGMSQVQTVKTIVHEVAHAMLHAKGADQEKVDRLTREVQAESVAFTVCSYLGLDTSDYSFAYVTSWSSGKDTKELTASMEVIRKTAKAIIDKVA